MSEPSEIQAACEQGLALHQTGQLDAARVQYEHVLSWQPDHFDALHLLGTLHLQTGRFELGEQLLARAVEVDPNSAIAHSRLGMAFWKQGRFEEALTAYDAALTLQPNFADACNDRGIVLDALGRPEEAIASHDQAIAFRPAFPEAFYNKGAQLHKLQRFEEACACQDAAIALRPDYAEAHHNRASALKELGRCEEAVLGYQRALSIRPTYVEAFCNMGMALTELRRLPEAMQCFDVALALSPDHADAHLGRSFALLLSGDLEAGLRAYGLRRSIWDPTARRFDQGQAWNGEDLTGKTLFAYNEHGLGDGIHFSRFIDQIDPKATKVVFSTQHSLIDFFQPLMPDVEVVGEDVTPGHFDYHCSLMNLPLAFKTSLRTIPPPTPYPGPDQDRLARLESLLGAKTKPRIGLAWSGNPTHSNDRNRSISFALLEPLLRLDVEWVVVQDRVQPRDASAFECATGIRFFGDELADFNSTAALVSLMDAVITVDTSIAHLAGAMGKPVAILIPYSPDWRWLLDGDETPWYPTARLYRQPRHGDWRSVIEKIGSDVAGRFGVG